MAWGRGISLISCAALALALLIGGAAGARPAELIMFKQPYCEWCQAWEEEVGVIYDKTEEGKRVPVRRVDIFSKRPDDLKSIKRIIFTPTFVLWNNGAEVGRIMGYPGEENFWGLLGRLLERLPGWRDKSAALGAGSRQGKETKQ